MAGAAMNRVIPAGLLAALLLAGCGGQSAAPTQPPLAGARIGGPFTLINQDGRPTSERDFAGRYRIMYFGYTFCPDVCPTDVQTIGAGLKALEQRDAAKAAKAVPIFVSIDPERDTPVVVKEFVANFHPRMVGLTGPLAAITQVAKKYGVYFAKQKPGASGSYLMDHSRQAYLMSPDGQPMALLPTEAGPEKVADELERWIT
ncbi:SCO family protein [Sphingomonas guangdongensis]|nr:SCO family protein [Sphingomonas guangdongensis]